MSDFEPLGTAYMAASSDVAEELREAGKVLLDGKMLPQSFEESIQVRLECLGQDFLSCLATYTELAEQDDALPAPADPVSIKVLLEEYKRNKATVARRERADLLEILLVASTLTSEEPVYTAAIAPLANKAGMVRRKVQEQGADVVLHLLPEDLAVVDQARAVVDAVREVEATGRSRSDERFRELGIDTTIFVGILLRKYSVSDMVSVEVDNVDEDDVVSGEAEQVVEDLLVHPTQRLPQRAPSAKVFLRAVQRMRSSVVRAVLYSTVRKGLLTADQICSALIFQAGSMPSGMREAVEQGLEALHRNGIFAQYEVGEERIYLLTEYGYRSLQKQEVRRNVGTGLRDGDFKNVLIAQESMSCMKLISAWGVAESQLQYLLWLKEILGSAQHAGRRLYPKQIGDTVRPVTELPDVAGGGEYRLEVYEYAKEPRADVPALRVVVMSDTRPLEDADGEFEPGALLLWDGTLYERRDGTWVPREIEGRECAVEAVEKNS